MGESSLGIGHVVGGEGGGGVVGVGGGAGPRPSGIELIFSVTNLARNQLRGCFEIRKSSRATFIKIN